MTGEILVVGARGRVGSEVIRALAERGARARALVRKPGTAPAGAQEVVGDLGDPASLAASLEGVDRAFFVTPHDPAEEALGRAFVDAALAAGVRRLVFASAYHADFSSRLGFSLFVGGDDRRRGRRAPDRRRGSRRGRSRRGRSRRGDRHAHRLSRAGRARRRALRPLPDARPRGRPLPRRRRAVGRATRDRGARRAGDHAPRAAAHRSVLGACSRPTCRPSGRSRTSAWGFVPSAGVGGVPIRPRDSPRFTSGCDPRFSGGIVFPVRMVR
ncbi:MAG: NmrA family NAD(P)-binding protein [Sandaracinaceae bacterium]|nr:NmrA family NAD(P)-binding protein [Sandaracinaceae bacterium]